MATNHHKYCHLTMELGMSWVFLLAILNGDLWRRGDAESVNGHEIEKESVCVKFLDQDFLCLQVSSVRSNWWSLEKAWFLLKIS
jgi:hypothetical protein